MRRILLICLGPFFILASVNVSLSAQFFSNSGANSEENYWGAWWLDDRHDLNQPRIRIHRPSVAQNYIVISGTAEVQAAPTSMRLVLAVIFEDVDAKKCKAATDEKIKQLTTELKAKLKIEEQSLFEDFVSLIPIYEKSDFDDEEKGVADHLIVKPDFYRYQSNLHFELTNHKQAREVLNIAISLNVMDVVTFDYWHRDQDSLKREARKKAVAAAREKADILLDPMIFEKKPPIINIQESTEVYFPKAQYASYASRLTRNTDDFSSFWSPSNKYDPQGPKIYFYQGPRLNADRRSAELPIKPVVSVVSTVVLYYESPASKRQNETNK